MVISKLFKLALPTTIVSMFLVTKWWYALPVDGPDKLHWGFPFAFMGEGFHTSMSFQFFILEFLADFSIYFMSWILVFYIFFRFYPKIKVPKILTKIIISIAIILSMAFAIIVSMSNPLYHSRRGYDWKILDTGYVFLWQETPRPDVYSFSPTNITISKLK